MGTFVPAVLGLAASHMQAQATRQQYAQQAQQMRLAQEVEQKRRQKALEVALASERARQGAAGIAGGGSGQALLAGLEESAAEEGWQDSLLAEERLNGLSAGARNARRRNLLDMASHSRRLFDLIPGDYQ